jgi:acetolactate synthase-1/2/3 large subunit
MKLADAIVTCLRNLDLKYLFGVSGANIEHIHDSVYRLGEGRLKTVMTKTEQGAAFMADGRARAHRTLGVCCATSGGGMMNLAVGIAESLAHNVPVLALVGQTPLMLEGRGGFQDSSGGSMRVDGLALFQSIAKYAVKIDSADSFWQNFETAIRTPFQGAQGPSVLLIPRDVMELEVGDIPAQFPTTIAELQQNADEYTELDHRLIDKLWQQLQQAQKPILILGADIARYQAETLATQFAQTTRMKVASTLSCPSIFPNQDDHYLGMIGIAGHPSAHQYLQQESDLILAVGTQLRIMTRGTLTSSFKEKSLWIANKHLGEFDPSLNASDIIQCNPFVFFRALLERNQDQPLNYVHSKAKPRLYFKPKKIQYQPWQTPKSKTIHFSQSQALQVIEPTLSYYENILLDAGNCAAAAAHYLAFPTGKKTLIALGMGGMGYAISAAIGAQLGEPSHKPTLVICGDGAFMMTGLEIHTAVELKLPILWIVFNNNMHGMCVTRQHLYFETRIEGNLYSQINIHEIVKGFGSSNQLWSACANNTSECETYLNQYTQEHANKPGILELKISQEEMPPIESFIVQPLIFARLG